MGELKDTHVEGLGLIVLSMQERASCRAERLAPWIGEGDWTHIVTWGDVMIGAVSLECRAIGGEVISPPILAITHARFKVRAPNGRELYATFPRGHRRPPGVCDARTVGFEESVDALMRSALDAIGRFMKDATP